MLMTWSMFDFAGFNLSAYRSRDDPIIGHKFCHGCSLFGINFQH